MRLSKKNQNKLWLILPVIIVILVVTYVLHTKQPVSSYKGQSLTHSSSKPSEVKPTSSNFIWVGKASDPKYIKLPTIKAEGYIEKVSVDQHGQVGVPDNIYMAAWYSKSVSPGQRGLSIIDGHVVGIHKPGIFRNLADLKPNDNFTVQLGNGDILQYKVMQNSSVSLDQVPNVLFSQNPKILSQLNLITCSGQYDYQTHAYNQREIVTAQLSSPVHK